MRERLTRAEERLTALRGAIVTAHCCTNEDGRQFVLADDLRAALSADENGTRDE